MGFTGRQNARGKDGRYTEYHRCELCNRPSGERHYSDERQSGELGVYGLVLCGKCWSVLAGVSAATAMAALIAAEAARDAGKPRPYNSRGRFYIMNEDGWQVVDQPNGMVIGGDTKKECEGIKRFAIDYVDLWGDIDFGSFPYSYDQPFVPVED